MLRGRFVFETEYERSLDDDPIMPENWVPDDEQLLSYIAENDAEEFVKSIGAKQLMWKGWEIVSNYLAGMDAKAKETVWEWLLEKGVDPIT